MDFLLSDEQQMLQDTVQRFIQTDYDFQKRRSYVSEPKGFSREQYAAFAELGLLGLVISEANGGFGGGGIEQMLVMESLGRGLVAEPYLSCALIVGPLLERIGNREQQERYLAGLIQGRAIFALAHQEPRARYDRSQVSTRAERQSGGYVLNGRKSAVLHGDGADCLLVSARTSGGDRDAGGVSLFLVDPASPGLEVTERVAVDGLHVADMVLNNVKVLATARVGEEGEALPAIEYALDCGVAALCADTLGAAVAAADMTLEYVKTRKQFGVTIGSFQALQHRLVDMTTELEQMRSMTILAASRLEAAPSVRRHAVSAAKFKVDKAARFVGQQAIQLHGGIGMTEEYAVGHYFKRITLNAQRLGDADYHLQRFRAAAPA